MKTVCRLVLVRTRATASVRQDLMVQRQGAGWRRDLPRARVLTMLLWAWAQTQAGSVGGW